MKSNRFFVLALVLFAAAGASYFYFNRKAEDVVDQHFERLIANGTYDEIDYENIEVDFFGDIKMTNLRLAKAGQEVQLRDIAVTNLDYKNQIPHTIDVKVTGVSFPDGIPFTGDPIGNYLQSFVTADEIPLEFQYSYEYMPENAFQVDSRMNMRLPDAFTLDVDGTMRNVPLESLMDSSGLDPDPTVAQLQMMQKLANMEIPIVSWKLRDEGIVDGLIGVNAEQSGQSPDAVREAMKSQVRDMYLFLPQSAQGFAMTTGIQIAAFLDGGKTLSIGLAPEYNGNFQQLQQEITGAAFTGDFGRIAELLHLEVLTQ